MKKRRIVKRTGSLDALVKEYCERTIGHFNAFALQRPDAAVAAHETCARLIARAKAFAQSIAG